MSQAKSYYEADVLEKQVNYCRSLSEKQRRHFVAMEYERLGEGSKRYVARIFGCHRQTINKGLQELSGNNYETDYARQRKTGGGRKKTK